VKIHLYYIIILIEVILIPFPSHAMDVNSKHLSQLQMMIDKNVMYDENASPDSVYMWIKQLKNGLEKSGDYDLFFKLKLLSTNSSISLNNVTLALDEARSMYEKAKKMNHPLGIALALRAIGDVYLVSSTPEEGIKSYKEALELFKKIPNAQDCTESTLAQLILMQLRAKQPQEAMKNIVILEQISKNKEKIPMAFFIPISYAFYYIHVNKFEDASKQIKVAENVYRAHPTLQYKYLLEYVSANYFLAQKDYRNALAEYDTLINHFIIESYRYTQVLQEKAQTLALMGLTKEACEIYEKINTQKDSLNARSYSDQINEFRTQYQVNQKEVENQEIQESITYWSICIALFVLLWSIYFIFRTKKDNQQLLTSYKELEKARIHAENSIRMKSLFLSNMSHEIRTPLNALSGFSSILTEESIDKETRKQCNDVIQQNSELLLKLINDVIDLSNMEIGKMSFCYEQSDAVAICKNVIETVEKIKQTQADLRFQTSFDSLFLTTDSSRLQQVLINLLINATKFTRKGSITLELKKYSNNIALFIITDTGCGIPEDKQNQIFNRFEKLDEQAKGTGLGLSICKLIVEQLGGEIWIDKDYKEGSRFLFTHPLQMQHQKEEENK